MVATVFKGLDGLPLQVEGVERGRMQAELCGLIARDTLLLVTKAGNRPGKAQKVGS